MVETPAPMPRPARAPGPPPSIAPTIVELLVVRGEGEGSALDMGITDDRAFRRHMRGVLVIQGSDFGSQLVDGAVGKAEGVGLEVNGGWDTSAVSHPASG